MIKCTSRNSRSLSSMSASTSILFLYSLVVVLVIQSSLVYAKPTRISQDLVENVGLYDDDTQQQYESDMKIKGLLEKYLFSGSAKHQKQPSHHSRLNELDMADDSGGDYDSSDYYLSGPAAQRHAAVGGGVAKANARSEQDEPIYDIVKKFRMPLSNKRAWDIQTYYDVLKQNDGSFLLIPKDVNKNHYFIG